MIRAGLALAAAVAALGMAAPRAQDHDLPQRVADALIEAHVPARDDPDGRFARLLTTATEAAASAMSEPLLAEATGLLSSLQDPARAIDLVQAYQAASPHGLGAAAARVLHSHLLVRLDRKNDAVAASPYRAYATRLHAIGPFGDSGDHYLDVVFAPELAFPGPAARLAGRFGPVRTRLARRRPRHRQIDLATPEHPRPGCYYGLHVIAADAALACYVEVAARGSFALFVNGERVHRIDRHTRRIPRVQRLPIALRKGPNHVMVKTATNGHAEVGLRYHDAAGRDLPGITELEQLPPCPEPAAVPRTPAFRDGLRVLADTAQQADGEARTMLLLAAGLTAFRQDHGELGMEMLHLLEAAPPGTGRVAVAFAALLSAASPLPAEIRQARARQLVEANVDALPDHHHVTMQRVAFLEGQDQHEHAIRLLQERIAAGLAGPTTFERLYGLLVRRRFDAAAYRLRAAWRTALPADPRPVLAMIGDRQARGDSRGALQLVRDALEVLPLDALRQRGLSLAQDLGEAELALQLLDALQVLEPDAVAALRDRALTLHRLGQAADARALDERIATHPDATVSQIAGAGDRLLHARADASATAAYRRVLAIDPSKHAVRRLLARLEGRDPLAAIARFRCDGDAIIRSFEATERERGSVSSLVLDQMIVQVWPDGSMVQETHQIRRINDLRGVEACQQAEAAGEADELVLLRTVGKDGASYLPNRVADGFSMPRLEPGAFVEEIHRQYHDSPAPGPWRAPAFYFRGIAEPYLRTELVVILPAVHPGSFRTRSFPGEPETVALDDGQQARIYRLTDVPRLPSERHPPPLGDIVPVVTYGEDADPDEVPRDAFANAGARSRVTPQVLERTREITSGVEGDRARAAAIHRFVHAEIAAGRSEPDPTAILLRGRGTRFFLQAAMLRSAGVPYSDAIVVRARDELLGRATALFLGEHEYEVPALRVEPRDAAPFWLFADAPRHTPLGMVPEERFGAAALLLRAGHAEPIRLPSGQPGSGTGLDVDATLRLDASGDATLTASIVVRGFAGFSAADRLRTAEEDMQRMVARQLAGEVFPGWALRAAGLADLDPPGQPLRITIEAHRRGALDAAGDRLLLHLPLAKTDFLATLGARSPRQLPLVLSDVNAGAWRLRVEPGPGLRLIALPDPLRVRHEMLEYDLRFARQSSAVVIHRNLVQHPGTIPPARIDAWLRLLQRLDGAEEGNLAFERR